MPTVDTATKLLDHAEAVVRERGFNAFSYKDLAEKVGIRTASIHYHFETKGDLGQALMRRYLEGLDETLREAARKRTAKARLRAFVDVYRNAEQEGNVCLCGSLASDIATLPEGVRALVRAYIRTSESWVEEQIAAGAAAGELAPLATPRDLAAFLVSGLQGALMLGRARPGGGSVASVERTFWKLLAGA